MTAKQFFIPAQTAFNSNGLAVPGALFNFYLPGTSTKTAIYTDGALTVPASNPVVANGAGRLPTTYLDASLNYRLKITDALGAVLDDIDPFIPGSFLSMPGTNGATASNLTIGLFTGCAGQDLTAGGTKTAPDMVFTSGYSTVGIGAAAYKKDATVTALEASTYPRFCFRDSQGNGYRIAGSAIDLDAIGGIPDNSTDNLTVFQDLDAYGVAHRRTPSPVDGVHGRAGLDFVSYPPFAVGYSRGGYYSSGTLLPSLPWYNFAHENNGIGGGSHTVFIRFASDIHGIIPNSSSTRGDQYTGANSQFDASGITFVGIGIFGSGTDRTKHGLWVRTKTAAHFCAFDGFPGDNLHISANSGSTGSGTNLTFGNANTSQFICNSFSNSGRHAIYVEGADANACTFIGNNVISAGAGAYIDQSFLGNFWSGNNIHGYDVNGQGRVAFGGNIYDLIDPTPGIGASTTPGTNSTVWYLRGTGTFTAWSNVGTYYPCCPILIYGASNRSVVVNPYIEGGSGAISHISKPGRCINPNADPGSESFTSFSVIETTSNDTGSLGNRMGIGSSRTLSDGTLHEVSVGGGEDTTIIKSARDAFDTWRMANAGNIITMSFGNVGVSQTWQFCNVALLGRATNVSYVHLFANFALGADTSAARKIDMLSAAPTSGSYAQGEFIFNSTPSAGGKLGWSCTTGGIIATSAWSATHVYAVGDLVTNDTGKSYICITAGTSAGSGGPTGTGGNITDGTAHWKYGAAFVFKPCGVIDA